MVNNIYSLVELRTVILMAWESISQEKLIKYVDGMQGRILDGISGVNLIFNPPRGEKNIKARIN
jgi:hypothetical protein